MPTLNEIVHEIEIEVEQERQRARDKAEELDSDEQADAVKDDADAHAAGALEVLRELRWRLSLYELHLRR
jgi:hypothetical protein